VQGTSATIARVKATVRMHRYARCPFVTAILLLVTD
jgi:hypothetical protein